jgi:hypothetical protein
VTDQNLCTIRDLARENRDLRVAATDDAPGGGQVSTHPWFRGLTSDHLYADCPSRIRSEKSLRLDGCWDVGGDNIDPHGGDVCGMCVARYDRKQRTPGGDK